MLWDEIAAIGRDPGSGGYLRYALGAAELALRDWFREQARRRGLAVTEDGNGNLLARWGDPDAVDAVLVGSHFDSVPHGGGYDGPLGIVSAFLAVDELRAAGVTPTRPVWWPPSSRRRGPGSAYRVWGRGCSPGRSRSTARPGCATRPG